MPKGTIRFWAAARAAAGVAEEPYDATTLAEALATARAAHGDDLAHVLDRCSYVVDDAPVGVRAHDTVRLTEGGSVEVLPPFAGGAQSVPGGVPHGVNGGIGGRLASVPPAVAGLAAALVAAALAGLALLHIGALAAGVFAVQVVVALAWLAALDVPGGGGAFVIVVIASGVMDGLVGSFDEPDIGRAAGVAAVAIIVSLLHQVARKPRVAVTLSFGGTVSAVAFAMAAASYIALRVESGGAQADAAALLGAGVALAVARLTDLALPRPAPLPGSRRGVVGLVVGLGAALVVGWGYGTNQAVLGAGSGSRLAMVAAVIALVADLAVDAVLAAAPPTEERARSGVPPLGILLPVVLAAPAAYVAGRILLG
jgi:molybdopterin converting factor small subunit